MLLSSSTIKIFCFVTMVFAFLLFFEFYNCYTCITLAEFAETIRGYMFLALQVIVNAFAECTGSLAVNDSYSF